MPSLPEPGPLSRRSVLLSSLGAGFALGTGSAPRRTAAQDATPLSLADHAIVGMWEVTYPFSPPSVAIFGSDGVYIEYMGHGGWGIGAGFWRVFESDTGEYVANFQQLANSAETSPETELFRLNYVPEAHEFLPEIVGVRVSFTIDPSENTFTTRGRMEVRDGGGNIIAGPFPTDESTGTRLVSATT